MASRGGGPPFPNLGADDVPGLWKAELPASSRDVLRTLGFMARYSQGSAFLDVVNLPSSCRSNCHACIKLLKKFPPVSLFPFHRVNIPTDPGLVADGLGGELNNNSSLGVSWRHGTQEVYVSQWKGKCLEQGRTQGNKSSFYFIVAFAVVGFILNLTRCL